MAISNKNKEKNPVLDEIENDNTPIDDKGNPIETPELPKVEDLLAKDPNDLTAAEMDILSDNKDELTDEQKVKVGLLDDGSVQNPEDSDDEEEDEEEKPTKKPVVKEEIEEEDPDEKRYKSQQTEAQIQAEKNRAYVEKVNEAANLPDPTLDELRDYVKADGAEWDELTNFEQAMAKKTLLADKRFSLVNESVQSGQKVDEWAKKVDDFIESTDGKQEYVELGTHEGEFRKFAMKEAHRATPIDILLSAFMNNLPPEKKTRGSLFNRGGGGEKEKQKTGIVDADRASQLRQNNPREYARQVKAGKIKIEV